METNTKIALWLAGFLDELGIDSNNVLRSSGVDPDLLDKSRSFIAVEKMTQIWETLAQLYGKDSIGILAAKHFDIGAMDSLGYLMVSSATLAEALENYCHFSELLSSAGESKVYVKNEHAIFETKIYHISMMSYFALDAYIGGTYHFLKNAVTLKKFVVSKVLLMRPTPTNTEEFESHFQAEVLYNQSRNALVFDRDLLEILLPYANINIYNALKSELSTAFKHAGHISLKKRVESYLPDFLNQEKPSEQKLAANFSVNLRTFQRLLKKDGTSYKKLLNVTRKRLSLMYLLECESKPTTVAYKLGFSNPASFTRAFKGWFGVSPSKMNRNSRQSPSKISAQN